MDDLAVTGKDHLKNLECVFETFLKVEFRLIFKKFRFFEPKIKYLGHIFD